jgi:hypothetical protein
LRWHQGQISFEGLSELRIEYNTAAGEERSEQVEPDRLVEEIEQIRRRFLGDPDAPYGMDVVSRDGNRLTVGFDDREGFLMYQPAGDQEWVRYSMGDPKRNDTKVFYVPQWTELSGKYMVPTRDLLDALRLWAQTGELDGPIEWTTEIF